MGENRTPNLEQVQAYARANGFVSNPFEFYEKYRRNGWRQNGEPVQNWRKLFDGWERTARRKARPQVLPAYKTETPKEATMTEAELKQIVDAIHAMQNALADNTTIEDARQQYEEWRKTHDIPD